MSSGTPTAAVGRGRLPVQGRRDHRAALSALALLLVVLGALGSALIVYRTGHRTDVLVAAHDIHPGDRVDANDFATARVAADSGSVVAKSDEDRIIGDYATVGIPEGTLVSGAMFQSTNVIPGNGVVVGVSVSADQRPAADVASGDVVRAFNVPKASADQTSTDGVELVSAARVVSVVGDQSSADTVTISLLVTADDAARLIGPAGQGTVSIAELPKTVKPTIDYQSRS